jgi:hypothetical protein
VNKDALRILKNKEEASYDKIAAAIQKEIDDANNALNQQ